MSTRRPTSTSNFGVGRREAHDASAFYDRFIPPELSLDTDVASNADIASSFVCGDARDLSAIPDNAVALVVTSPPYFAGKQYEEELGAGATPSSYLEYLGLLRDVFRECKRVLEPGGRIAVNVANLGRKPFRSLASDVVSILQDDLHLLLRGEIIWQKGEGASGSCAWGSFRSPANPVLRDVTERVIIASKGRFDRALSAAERERRGLPHASSLTSDEFMAATLDLWEIAPESAQRVDHPAPFPVELPERLIQLNTYVGDLVLDPFMGSGSTLVAAARTNRRYVGYDLDADYVERARSRVQAELAQRAEQSIDTSSVDLTAPTPHAKTHRLLAEAAIEKAGFQIAKRNTRLEGMRVDVVATDEANTPWYFVITGALTNVRAGLARIDALWRTLGLSYVLAERGITPVVVISSHFPRRSSEGDVAMRAGGPRVVFDALSLGSPDDLGRLGLYAKGGQHERPLPGYWSAGEAARSLP